MLSLVRNAVAMLGTSKNSAVFLSEVLPEATPATLTSVASTVSKESLSFMPEPVNPTGRQHIGGLLFLMFPQSTREGLASTPGESMLHYSQEVPEFGLARTEVTEQQFAQFLKDNPEWTATNRTTLQQRGLVDEGYLRDFDVSAASDKPITGVSWFAATAYCDWLTKSAPKGYRVALPTEMMWETAAFSAFPHQSSFAVFKERSNLGPLPVGSMGYDASGFADLFGNVWEWTSESYRPYPWIRDESVDFNRFANASDLKAVRGGSWANAADEISLASRGPIPASHASEFLGFRPALVRQ